MSFSEDSPVAIRLKHLVDIHKATALMFYHPKASSGKLIHELKYHNKPEIGALLAEYLAPKLRADKPDIIIPIPLHRKKMKIRGYNQLELFGKKLASRLNAHYNDGILLKTTHTETQTTKNPMERWKNVMKTFEIRNPEILKQKHILLIDDVLTTGATLSAAAKLLKESQPEIKLSVAVMAYNRH